MTRSFAVVAYLEMDPLEFLPPRIEEWRAAFETLDDAARLELGTALVTEWVAGRLEPRLLEDAGGLRALRSAIAQAIEGLGLWEIEWNDGKRDESVARRWCWIKPWILSCEDEDLLLMADDLVAPLLEEAAAGCTKRAYAIAIVQHRLRDRAHGALRHGWDETCARIKSFERWLPQIRAVDDPALLAYVERLAGYTTPRELTLRGAEARVKDFWRCHAPGSVVLRQVGREWHTPTDSWSHRSMIVDAKTGALRIDATSRVRAGRKARWPKGRW